MEQHRLIKWLKFLVIFAAGCGMVMDLGVLPGVGSWDGGSGTGVWWIFLAMAYIFMDSVRALLYGIMDGVEDFYRY